MCDLRHHVADLPPPPASRNVYQAPGREERTPRGGRSHGGHPTMTAPALSAPWNRSTGVQDEGRAPWGPPRGTAQAWVCCLRTQQCVEIVVDAKNGSVVVLPFWVVWRWVCLVLWGIVLVPPGTGVVPRGARIVLFLRVDRLLAPSGVGGWLCFLTESLILAQDERWRCA